LGVSDLTGDVGDDRPVSGQVSRSVGEFGEGLEVDCDVDHTLGSVVRELSAIEYV
jgi:hypothetical protein